jgi:hypothetical protein
MNWIQTARGEFQWWAFVLQAFNIHIHLLEIRIVNSHDLQAIIVAAHSKAWTVFARSNTGIVGSNPSRDMDICLCVYSVFVLSCVQVAALRWADPPSKASDCV